MNVINAENDYRNGVVVQLDAKDTDEIKRLLEQFPYSVSSDTVIDLVKWIIKELEE